MYEDLNQRELEILFLLKDLSNPSPTHLLFVKFVQAVTLSQPQLFITHLKNLKLQTI